MPLPWANILPAAIGGLASLIGGNSANQANQQMARQQMAFQERMSNTAVQRHVADLKKAGLNPMLGYSGQASSPAGAMAKMENIAPDAVASAAQAYSAGPQVDVLKAQESSHLASAAQQSANAAYTAEKLNEGGPKREVEALMAAASRDYASADASRKSVEKMGAEIKGIEQSVQESMHRVLSIKQDVALKGKDIVLKSYDVTKQRELLDTFISEAKARAEKINLELPGARNEAAAQEAAWREALAKSGLSKDDQNGIMRAIADIIRGVMRR